MSAAITPDARHAAWRDQFESLWADLTHLARLDDMFWQLNAIIEANPDARKDASFVGWLGTCYAATVATGIRRLVDKRSDTLSFVTLLQDMTEHSCEVLTRARFYAIWGKDDLRRAPECFSKLGAGDAGHISSSFVAAKRDALIAAAARVVKYTNKVVAHRDLKGAQPEATWKDTREALAQVFRVAQWCMTLLTSGTPVSPVPTYMGNWLTVFESAWLADARQLPTYRKLDDVIKELAQKDTEDS